jgi:hypothetical protein
MLIRSMPVGRKSSLVLSLLVVAATCMCVCTDTPAGPVAAPSAHPCCDVDHTKSSPAKQSNHDDCRACGLKVWSGARLSAVSITPYQLAVPVAILPPVLAIAPLLDSLPLSFGDSPPPSLTLLALHCQLTC